MTPAPRRTRRDAQRNEMRVLEAARASFATVGVADSRVEEIAREAGVGVGTLYRAFGDKAGLVWAVLDEQERQIQDAVLRGPPPLGPGAPPRERIHALLERLVAFVDENRDALRVSERGPIDRSGVGAYAAWRLHLTVLLSQASPELDHLWLADALLAPLAADLVHTQRTVLEMPTERILTGLRTLVDACVPGP